MLDIGWTELLVIAVVLIVVVGPKDLPPMLRAFGKMTGNLRKMAGDFRTQFDQALREADMDDVRQTISDVQKFHPANAIREAINPLREMGNEIRNDLQRSTTLPVSSGAEAADGAGDVAASSTASVEDLLPASSLGLPEASLPTQPPASLSQQAPTAATSAPAPAPQASAAQPPATSPEKARGKAAKSSTKAADAELVPAKAPARKRVTKASVDTPPAELAPAKPKPARKLAAAKAAVVASAESEPGVARVAKPRKKPASAQVKAPKQVDVPKDEA